MKILKALFTLVCSSHMALLVLVGIVVHDLYLALGRAVPASVWTMRDVIQVFVAFAVCVILGYMAGRESRLGAVRFWKAAARKWQEHHRTMLDMNKTMIDDVLMAQAAGVKVKTFLHGCGMVEKPPARDPADAPGVSL
jgi:hypothetical protein